MPKPPLDPAYASLVKQPRERLYDAGLVRRALAEARRKEESGPPSAAAEVLCEDISVFFAEREDKNIPIRIYRPKDTGGDLPTLLYLHGGGFFCGDQYSEERQCREYASGARCLVVSVGYRLAPEHPFPAGLSDCYRVLAYLEEGHRSLRLMPEAIAVGGSSAGANLAAAVSLLARDRKGPRIGFQMLLVPALDYRLETPSAREFTDVPDFARPEAETMWRWYLGERTRPVSPYASPAEAEDLSDLPAAYVLCAGLDPLRDEGLDYAQRLSQAGVPVELRLVPSIPHGFASIPSAAVSQRLLREQVEVLQGAFLRLRNGL